jgi:hypothetical protein
MSAIKFEGNEVELAEDWRVGELIRAENALDIDMEGAKAGARSALVLYISLARHEPWKTMQPGSLADLVMRMDVSGMEKVDGDDAGPPAEVPAPASLGAGKDSETDDPLIFGTARLEATA